MIVGDHGQTGVARYLAYLIFSASQRSTTGVTAYGETSQFKENQMTVQFCFATRAESKTYYTSFNSVGFVYATVKWAP